MSLLERGRIDVKLNTLRQITDVLEIDLAFFFAGVKEGHSK